MENHDEDRGPRPTPERPHDSEGKLGDSGRSEDWVDSQGRYGERQDWDYEGSYGADWDENRDETVWDNVEHSKESLPGGQTAHDRSRGPENNDNSPNQGAAQGTVPVKATGNDPEISRDPNAERGAVDGKHPEKPGNRPNPEAMTDNVNDSAHPE